MSLSIRRGRIWNGVIYWYSDEVRQTRFCWPLGLKGTTSSSQDNRSVLGHVYWSNSSWTSQGFSSLQVRKGHPSFLNQVQHHIVPFALSKKFSLSISSPMLLQYQKWAVGSGRCCLGSESSGKLRLSLAIRETRTTARLTHEFFPRIPKEARRDWHFVT